MTRLASPRGTRVSLSVSIVAALSIGAAAASVPARASPPPPSKRAVTKLAEGVYEIRHDNATLEWPSGNTTVVIGSREVLVVDSCVVPSAAAQDIADIRRLTNKPVRYLVNTHWHIDHNGGNHTYAKAFPGLAIVAQRDGKRMMDDFNPGVPVRFIANYEERLVKQRANLAEGKDEDGKPLEADGRADGERQIADEVKFVNEYKSMVYESPTLAFDRALDIDLGGRVVQIRFLGRGNTLGDAVVFLPAEKIVATGDLLDDPVPFTFDGYPAEWGDTLAAVAALGATTIVPGHGDVEHDRRHLDDVRAYLASAVQQVRAEIAKGGSKATLEVVRKVVDLSEFRAKFVGSDPGDAELFDQGSAKLVELVYNESKQR